jgi:hypothetical protein
MRCSSAGVFGTGDSYEFPCARTDASAIKSKRSRQLTIDFAKYDVKRPEHSRDISEHMSA